MCRGGRSGFQQGRGRPQTHRVDSEAIVGNQPEESDYEEVISHVYRVGNRLAMAPELQINRKKVQMEIDTGAAVSLISEKTKSDLFPSASLTKPSLSLRTYTSKPKKGDRTDEYRCEIQWV